MTDDKRPLVGVIVPVRNAGRWLDEMLASLQAQTYPHWRAIVVDDGSDDNSAEVAERHQQADPRIAAVAGPGSGRGAPLTRAYGRSLVSDADFLYFPDGDDVLAPELIATLLARLQADPFAGATFCRFTQIDEMGQLVAEAPHRRMAMSRRWARSLPDDEPNTPFESVYAWAAPVLEPMLMFRAGAYDEAGGWEEWPEQGGESVDLLCRIIALGARVVFEPCPLYLYRRHDGQHGARQAQRYVEAPLKTRAAWQRRAQVDPSLRPEVTRAEFFIAHRLIPRTGLEAALRHARCGRFLLASRFLVGAIRRYRWRVRAVEKPKPADSSGNAIPA
jgi:glycosyltransferase involved in cell wall biosynthesis